MLVTSHLSRFFAPLAIAAISIALSSTAIAQCSGPSCGKPAGLGYAPIAIAPVATYNSGWTNSYASGPVFTSMPAAPAPIQAGIANSIPVQSFQPAPQPIQAVSLTYAQPIAVQTAPAYLGPSFARAVAQPAWPVQPIQIAAPTFAQPAPIQTVPVPYSAPAVSLPVAQPAWYSAQPQSGCANGTCPLR